MITTTVISHLFGQLFEIFILWHGQLSLKQKPVSFKISLIQQTKSCLWMRPSYSRCFFGRNALQVWQQCRAGTGTAGLGKAHGTAGQGVGSTVQRGLAGQRPRRLFGFAMDLTKIGGKWLQNGRISCDS